MYKTILVHVDATARCAARVDLAARLAVRFDAHLVGAAMTGLSAELFPHAAHASGMPGAVFPIEQLRAEADSALDLFEQQAIEAGVPSIERRRIDDEASMAMCLQARYCDLAVISQVSRDEFAPRLRTDFPDYVVLNCARPVLVTPAAGAGPVPGERIVVAWNASSNAVRALASALPMLQGAQQVSVLSLDTENDGHTHAGDAALAAYLGRHGIQAEFAGAGAGSDPGAALLSFAAGKNADLIVMGAYGHSRFSEMILGGASRTALLASPIALWMAH